MSNPIVFLFDCLNLYCEVSPFRISSPLSYAWFHELRILWSYEIFWLMPWNVWPGQINFQINFQAHFLCCSGFLIGKEKEDPFQWLLVVPFFHHLGERKFLFENSELHCVKHPLKTHIFIMISKQNKFFSSHICVVGSLYLDLHDLLINHTFPRFSPTCFA